MKQIKIDLKNEEEIEKAAESAAEILKRKGVIIYPTDTLYGIGANAFCEDAILKVYKIKRQKRDKPVSVVVKDMKMARKISCIDSKAEKTLGNIWPGPVTVVLRKKDSIPYILTGGKETVAIRIPKSEFISALFEKIDFPLTATSANVSGEKDLLDPKEIIEKFSKDKTLPDLFVSAGKVKNLIASTIVDLTESEPKIIRVGVVGREKMKEFFGKFVENSKTKDWDRNANR